MNVCDTRYENGDTLVTEAPTFNGTMYRTHRLPGIVPPKLIHMQLRVQARDVSPVSMTAADAAMGTAHAADFAAACNAASNNNYEAAIGLLVAEHLRATILDVPEAKREAFKEFLQARRDLLGSAHLDPSEGSFS